MAKRKLVIQTIEVSGFAGWQTIITDAEMSIGCETHPHADWRMFTVRDLVNMGGKEAGTAWKANRTELLKLCDLVAGRRKKKKKAAA